MERMNMTNKEYAARLLVEAAEILNESYAKDTYATVESSFKKVRKLMATGNRLRTYGKFDEALSRLEEAKAEAKKLKTQIRNTPEPKGLGNRLCSWWASLWLSGKTGLNDEVSYTEYSSTTMINTDGSVGYGQTSKTDTRSPAADGIASSAYTRKLTSLVDAAIDDITRLIDMCKKEDDSAIPNPFDKVDKQFYNWDAFTDAIRAHKKGKKYK